jgi:trans-2-enoyl-CoA reductase
MAEIEPRLGDEIPEEWTKRAESEIRAKSRTITLSEFRGAKNVEIVISHPTTGDDTQSTNIYSKAYNRFLRDPDFMTKSQMKRLLEERKLWGEEQEQVIDTCREDMRAIELQVAQLRVKKSYNKASVSRLRTQWFGLKNKIQTLVTERENYYSNTVEGRAEEEQLKSKLSLCVKFPDGKKVWNSIEELDNETDKTSIVATMNAAIIFWMGMTQEIIDELPAMLFASGEEKSENLQDK